MRYRIYLAGTVAAAAWSAGAAAQNIKEMQLVSAAQDCRAGEVAELLRQGVNSNARNSGGYTPLMTAAGNGCKEAVQLLINAGADVSIKHADFGDAAAQAKMHGHREVLGILEAAAGGQRQAVEAARAPVTNAGAKPRSTPPSPVAVAGSTAKGWPKLGHYQPGRKVLYSGTAGKTWDRGTIKSIDPTYGYNIKDVTGSTDAYFVVGAEREPFWTNWFVGDWRVSVPMAMGAVTDGRYIYRTVSGGMRLPPLRISSDGTYSWRVQVGKGEQLIKGRWEPNPSGPGVVLKNAEKGADWLVYNNSRTDSKLGETVILSSECCTYYDGSRLK